MENFKFKTKLESFEDYRAGFANRICKLLYYKSNGDLNKCVKEGDNLFIDIENHVRNVYELIDSNIPLMAYYELLNDGPDNWDFTAEEYEQALLRTAKACKEYYS